MGKKHRPPKDEWSSDESNEEVTVLPPSSEKQKRKVLVKQSTFTDSVPQRLENQETLPAETVQVSKIKNSNTKRMGLSTTSPAPSEGMYIFTS